LSLNTLVDGLLKNHFLILTEGLLIGAYIKQYHAVEGMTISFRNPVHSGTITIVSPPSEKAMDVSENKCYLDNMEISITNGSDGSTTINATGTGYINATTQYILLEDEKPLRTTDKNNVSILMTGTIPTPPYSVSTYYTDVRITDAGQNKSRSA
jgi:hypothetical protein